MTDQYLFDENEYAQRTYVEDGEYAPTTEVLRATYATDYYMTDVWGGPGVTIPGRAAAFDRWLAWHDAEVAAKALRWMAREYEDFATNTTEETMPSQGGWSFITTQDWLRQEAERIEAQK